MKKLNLGCGLDYKEGWINVDTRKNIKTDMRFDLNKTPYPIKKNTIDLVYMRNVIEHLDNPIKVLKELCRICKNGAIIKVYTNHSNSYAYISGIEHKGQFNEHTFAEYHLKEYELDNLKLIKQEFIYANKWKKYVPFKRFLKIYLNGIYDDLYYKFEVIK